jgi:hypothetical protein
VEVKTLFSRGKKKLKVDLGELKDETESLVSFLRSKVEAVVTSRGNKLSVDSENVSAKELKRLVNKFVYHRHLNNKYWVGLDGDVVKVKRFKHSKKKEEQRGPIPSTIKHGW